MANDANTLLERRKELLRKRIAESGVAAAAAMPAATPRATAGERHPLSDGQRRMWFLQTRDPRDTTLNICVAYRLTGALDGERLRRAVGAVAERHDILRTTYGLGEDGEPYQIARADLAPGWETHDLGELPETSRARRLEVLARREFGRPFDLSAESPLRLSLVRLAADEFALILVAHHICWDDDSWAVFFGEVNAAYGSAELATLPGQFVDVEVFGADATASATDLDYWRDALRPLPEALELPGKSIDSGSRQAERRTLALSAELMSQVDAFAREHHATPFMVLLAAYEAVVHRYTAAGDFLVSVPVTVRRNAIAESLIGYFGNTLLLRATLTPRDSFAAFTAAVRDTCLGAFAHQGAGIDAVVRAANPERLGGKDGLDQLVRLGFSVRKSAGGFALDGVEATLLELGSPVTQLPLSLAVVLEPTGAYLEAEYQLDQLDGPLIDQLLCHYTQLLGAALADPSKRIGDLDILGAADAARILELSHGELVATPAITMVDLFQDRVAAAPDALAVVAPDTGAELTYADLNSRANRLAHWLIGQGLGAEDLVGLRLSNSVEFVVGMLAVLKSGAAYLPIDPAYPDDRIDYLVDDARPRLVLGRVELDAAELSATDLPEHDPSAADRLRALRPGNLAYVIYTSGSTGKPKGVPVPHGAIAEHLDGFVAEWGMTAEDRLLQSSSVSFDASLLDIFVTFTAGACLVVPKPDAFRDIPYVAEIITRCGVTVLHMVPSMLSTFLLLPEVSQWRALRHVPVGGEALPGEIADKFAGIFDAELRNHYGPTEAVVCATHQDVVGPQGTRIVPIGTPNRNVYVYLLDAALQLVPAGVVGEIYLGGEQLARGYLDRAGLSAERFVADPFGGPAGVPGARLYRTGDLARRNADGEIEFVGRADEQVKVRGFRIELGEVEAVLGGHPSVGHCVVITTEDPAVGAMLAAYVVPAAGATVDPEQLRAHAATVLPEYMVPAAVAVIDAIPLTVHGKLDKRALPTPERRVTRGYREPATATEIRLAALFGQLFARDRVGADDSFFELGGHSLLATRLIVVIRKEFGVELDVRAPFDTPTVAGLAALIENAPTVAARAETPGPARRARPERVPLSFSQLAMWFQRKLEGPSAVGNIPFAMRVDGPLDLTALTAALGDVVARHEALRTVFPEDGGVPYQSVLPAGPIDVLVTVLDDPDRLPAELAEAAAYRFAVESELLVRPKVFVLDRHSHAISLLVHHMVADHWSFRTILADLAVAYRSRIDTGSAPYWEPLPLDYADFALWQRELVTADQERIDYWRDTLTGLPDEINPAHDHPRPAVLGKQGSMTAFTVPAELRRRLRALAEAAGASEFMLYQAAVVTLLHKLGGGVDIPLGTPVAGRSYPVASDLVGLLANMVVLRNDLSGDPSLRTVLDRSRNAALGAYANQDVPLERVVEAVNPPRSRSRNPLFQAMMHFREEDWSAGEAGLGEAEISVLPIEFDISLLDLSINFFAAPDGGFDASVIVNTDLYEATTGDLLAQRMLRVLTAYAETPDLALSELDVMPEPERRKLLEQWSTGPTAATLTDPDLLDHLHTIPADRPAVRRGDELVTYGELAAWAQRTMIGAADGAAADGASGAGAGHFTDGASGGDAVLTAEVTGLLSGAMAGGWAVGRRLGGAVAAGTGSGPGGDRVTPVGDATIASGDSAAADGEICCAAGESAGSCLVAAAWGSGALVAELLSAIATGATVIIADEAVREDPAVLVELITRHLPARVAADPGTLARFVHTGVSMLPSVRHWEVLGNDWPAALPDLLPALSSESTATYAYVVPGFPGVAARGSLTDAATAVPAPGARVLVLDDDQRPVPPGVVGTVYAGFASAELSASAPLIAGEALVRSFDRARWTVHGELEFAVERERAVVRPSSTAGAIEFDTAPGGADTEARLCAILAELLELEADEVGGEDNFFALGGDSVISIQWSVRANEIGLPLSPQLVFECMTVTELATAVDAALAAGVTTADIAAAAGVSAAEMSAAFGGPVPAENVVPGEIDAAPVVSTADAHSHAPMSASGLNQDALAALGAAWKGAR